MLEAYAKEGFFNLKEIPAQILNENSISSTRVREALVNGTLDDARMLLGYEFFFKGKVVEGNKLGRTIGYPTANLDLDNEEKIIPANGVYAVMVRLMPDDSIVKKPQHDVFLHGMMNIGIRPTVGGQKRVIEVNLFDFNEMIYDRLLEVTLVSFLRKEQAFNGLESLKEQLGKDRLKARDILSNQ
jgi:riboflavin kinase/FMN adenylyltransferase